MKKKLLVLLALLLVQVPNLMLPNSVLAASKKRVLMVINQGYRPEEYFEPRKLFDAAGFDVKVAARYMGDVLPSRAHISKVPPVPANLTYDKVAVDDFDAVVFVGGNGAWNELIPNKDAHRILLEASKKGKTTALICASAGLLATAGNFDGKTPQFKGKKATGYFEVEGLMRQVGGIKYDAGESGKPCVIWDGTLITGRDPISATLFGETIVAALNSDHSARSAAVGETKK